MNAKYLAAAAAVSAAIAAITWIYFAVSGARMGQDASLLLGVTGILAVALAALSAVAALTNRSR